VEVAPYKEDPMDFVLWKPSDAETPGWDSPWGRGRPGWHIECSAMAYELLGETFDIHGGGNDLTFPHHENEIAQSKCMGHGFANVWMHNEMLQVEGKKMSKSLGNFFTVRDLLDQGVPGEVIRFVFLSTHYRKPMDWTAEKAREAEATLRKWYKIAVQGAENAEPNADAVKALSEDLNTHGALAEAHKLAAAEDVDGLRGTLRILGLFEDRMPEWANDLDASEVVKSWIEVLLAERDMARVSKDYARADAIRDGFVDAGVIVKDTSDGATWELAPEFDQDKLEALK
ncbi:MAG: class I tRNA ligase family protein, partial [Paracoccaceae bacterium]